MTPDALGPDRRAQTVQDFAVGASVFLLTVAFTFAFVPSIFTPFDSEVAAGAGPQADRVATSLTQDLSMDERSNWLDPTRTGDFFRDTTEPDSTEDLQNRFDLPFASNVNITVVPIEGGEPIVSSFLNARLAIGDEFHDRPAASVSRVVVIPGVRQCDPTIDAGGDPGIQGKACRMTVRVW